ncbi:MAG: hypothetical protein ACREDC_00110 [Bradyrhizobium sp.]
MHDLAPQLRVRDATGADVAALCGPITCRAMAAEWRGRLVAVFGIRYASPSYGFADLVPDIEPRAAVALVTAGRRLVRAFSGTPILVVADPMQPTAPRLLRCLGFTPYATSVHGDVWRYAGRA